MLLAALLNMALAFPIGPAVLLGMFFNRGREIGIANDAGSFSQAGLKATTLLPFRIPQQMVAWYHQKRDTPDVLTMEPLLNVLKTAFEWIRNDGE